MKIVFQITVAVVAGIITVITFKYILAFLALGIFAKGVEKEMKGIEKEVNKIQNEFYRAQTYEPQRPQARIEQPQYIKPEPKDNKEECPQGYQCTWNEKSGKIKIMVKESQ